MLPIQALLPFLACLSHVGTALAAPRPRDMILMVRSKNAYDNNAAIASQVNQVGNETDVNSTTMAVTVSTSSSATAAPTAADNSENAVVGGIAIHNKITADANNNASASICYPTAGSAPTATVNNTDKWAADEAAVAKALANAVALKRAY